MSHQIFTIVGWVTLSWLLVAALANMIVHWGRGSVPHGLAIASVRFYAHFFHHLRVRGRANIPADPTVDGRPVIVVANHTASLDPVLIQAAMPYPVRWLMAADMRVPSLDSLWEFTRVIFVDRTGKAEIAGLREAMRSLSQGECVGIFPEGRIRRTRSELHQFLPGLGLMVAKSKALVLPVVIRGTPHCETTWGAFWLPSRSRVSVMPLIDYGASGIKTGEIAADLRARYVEWLAGE